MYPHQISSSTALESNCPAQSLVVMVGAMTLLLSTSFPCSRPRITGGDGNSHYQGVLVKCMKLVP